MKVPVLFSIVSCCFGLAFSRGLQEQLQPIDCGHIPQCRAPDLGCKIKYVTDKNGCLTGCTYDCPCPLASCLDICPNGYVLDENGCRTCQCKCGPPPACAPPPAGCTAKLETDANGCPVGCDYDCTCNQFQLCPNVCLFGYRTDKNGCQTCQCKCGPLPPCAAPPPGCNAVFVKDENGCVTGCNYVCPCGPLKLCPNACKSGYLKDKNGCDTCQCRCPLSQNCNVKCPNGFLNSANGCPTCQCVPDLECHKWMKCSQGVCPTACACKPNCLEIIQK